MARANIGPNAEITKYYSFCDLYVQLPIADKIGFVDFLTHSRYVPGVTRGGLPSSRFTGSAVPAYFGAIKRIVVTTHRQVLSSAVSALLDLRLPRSACMCNCMCTLAARALARIQKLRRS